MSISILRRSRAMELTGEIIEMSQEMMEFYKKYGTIMFMDGKWISKEGDQIISKTKGEVYVRN